LILVVTVLTPYTHANTTYNAQIAKHIIRSLIFSQEAYANLSQVADKLYSYTHLYMYVYVCTMASMAPVNTTYPIEIMYTCLMRQYRDIRPTFLDQTFHCNILDINMIVREREREKMGITQVMIVLQ
jgi:hypothetical protein